MEKNTKNKFCSYLVKDEKSNDVYRVVLLCLALIVILLFVWAYPVLFRGDTIDDTFEISIPKSAITAEKEQIIERFKTADKVPLTHAEQINSIRFISTQNAIYTIAERDLIIKTLGAKQ